MFFDQRVRLGFKGRRHETEVSFKRYVSYADQRKKKEMFYPQFKEIESIEDLRGRTEEYIRYYNEERIQERLMGMTPAAYQAMWPRLCPAVIQ